MKLKHLTRQHNSSPVFINPEHVVGVANSATVNGTSIYTTASNNDGAHVIAVSESLEEVVRILTE